MKNTFKIDNSTYILMLLALLSGYIKNVFLILIIVLIHEFGHVFFFYLFKYEIECVVIYPFGGVSKVNKRIHERIYKDVLVSVGGVLFQIMLFAIFYLLYEWGVIVKNTYDMFCIYNMRVILFNLIPLVPLDGSKLLFAISTKYLSFRNSYILMVIVGSLSLIMFIVLNFIFRLNDLVIYVFLVFSLIKVVGEYRGFMNKFYIERILYDNYYNGIVYGDDFNKMRLDKYYYFKCKGKILNEKNYLLRKH